MVTGSGFHVIISIDLRIVAIWKKMSKSRIFIPHFQHFWTFWKIAWLWEDVIAKPLDLQLTMGYQWKDKILLPNIFKKGNILEIVLIFVFKKSTKNLS